MSIKPIPAYNQGNGNQLRDAFRNINEQFGAEVVTNIHKITNTRYRHPYRASGRQLRTAFEQVNNHIGVDLVDLNKIQNIADGKQLNIAFQAVFTAALNLVRNGNFDAGETNWILGANIAIADGVAYFDALNGALEQVIAKDLGFGKTFQLTFDILPGATFSANGLAIFLDGDGATVNTGGAQSIEFTSGNTDNTLVFESITPGDFEGEITNISLRGVLNIKTQTICVKSIGGVSGKEFKINGKLINNCKVCKS